VTKQLDAGPAGLSVVYHPLFTQPDSDVENTWHPVPFAHLACINLYTLNGGKKMLLTRYEEPSRISSELDVAREFGGGNFVAAGIANATAAAADPTGKLRNGGILQNHYFSLPGALRLPPAPPPDVAAAPPVVAAAPAAPVSELGPYGPLLLAIVGIVGPMLLQSQEAASRREARADELAEARIAAATAAAAAAASEARTHNSAMLQALVTRPVAPMAASDAPNQHTVFMDGVKLGRDSKPVETTIAEDVAAIASSVGPHLPTIVAAVRSALPGAAPT
jgi:hypothetical protein